MVRTIQTIKSDMTTPFMANPVFATLYGFVLGSPFETNFSKLSFENIAFDIVAFAIFIFEQILDQNKKEVDDKIFNQKAGRLPWYKTKALDFQFGHALVTDQDYYDNAGYTEQEIIASKVVRYAAVGEVEGEARIIIKIAGEVNNKLAPIPLGQKQAFEAYIKDIKWPRPITIINYLPDLLYLNVQIERDALVLSETGMSILNGNNPVNDAIAAYMKELGFDGEIRLSELVARMKAAEGVKDATIFSAESAWISPTVDGYGQPQSIIISKIPESGYFEVVTYDNITYVV